MTQRTEAEIRAEIELCQSDIETSESNIGLAVTRARRNALTWVLAASSSPVAGDDEIVEAMARAIAVTYDCAEGEGWDVFSWQFYDAAKRSLAAARPLIERAAMASADAEIAALRASLAKAAEALNGVKPYLEVATISKWRDALLADVVAALSDLRKARP